jgi:hypothetical protein
MRPAGRSQAKAVLVKYESISLLVTCDHELVNLDAMDGESPGPRNGVTKIVFGVAFNSKILPFIKNIS